VEKASIESLMLKAGANKNKNKKFQKPNQG